ncbi:MAG: phosphotransferase, partial [Candidatus Diapherotrites archaeon]|nr:phosphotransferase [Candidatus Diapherotrites archaeon]
STADITHEKWLAHVKESIVEEENGCFKAKNANVHFIVGTEIQCSDLVHNLVFLPDLSEAQNLRGKIKNFGILDSWGCGRPRLRLSSEMLAEKVSECNGIAGPAHAFTPYFSVYAHFDSIAACYKSQAKSIHFIELGLSADSYFADLIPDNRDYQFLTCSDSHSPWPHRIGREFTRIKMREPSFKELKKALEKKDEKLVTLNAGLDPREGKYHLTACNDCHERYAMQEALRLRWRCTKCGGAIKRGVRDRITMLASGNMEEKHPAFRPPYLHLLPLAEIIQLTLEAKKVENNVVQSMWRDFVDRFGNEISALVDTPAEELAKVDARVAESVAAFRKGLVTYLPGGGGEYGKPFICKSEEGLERKNKEIESGLAEGGKAGQSTLGEF